MNTTEDIKRTINTIHGSKKYTFQKKYLRCNMANMKTFGAFIDWRYTITF